MIFIFSILLATHINSSYIEDLHQKSIEYPIKINLDLSEIANNDNFVYLGSMLSKTNLYNITEEYKENDESNLIKNKISVFSNGERESSINAMNFLKFIFCKLENNPKHEIFNNCFNTDNYFKNDLKKWHHTEVSVESNKEIKNILVDKSVFKSKELKNYFLGFKTNEIEYLVENDVKLTIFVANISNEIADIETKTYKFLKESNFLKGTYKLEEATNYLTKLTDIQKVHFTLPVFKKISLIANNEKEQIYNLAKLEKEKINKKENNIFFQNWNFFGKTKNYYSLSLVNYNINVFCEIYYKLVSPTFPIQFDFTNNSNLDPKPERLDELLNNIHNGNNYTPENQENNFANPPNFTWNQENNFTNNPQRHYPQNLTRDLENNPTNNCQNFANISQRNCPQNFLFNQENNSTNSLQRNFSQNFINNQENNFTNNTQRFTRNQQNSSNNFIRNQQNNSQNKNFNNFKQPQNLQRNNKFENLRQNTPVLPQFVNKYTQYHPMNSHNVNLPDHNEHSFGNNNFQQNSTINSQNPSTSNIIFNKDTFQNRSISDINNLLNSNEINNRNENFNGKNNELYELNSIESDDVFKVHHSNNSYLLNDVSEFSNSEGEIETSKESSIFSDIISTSREEEISENLLTTKEKNLNLKEEIELFEQKENKHSSCDDDRLLNSDETEFLEKNDGIDALEEDYKSCEDENLIELNKNESIENFSNEDFKI